MFLTVNFFQGNTERCKKLIYIFFPAIPLLSWRESKRYRKKRERDHPLPLFFLHKELHRLGGQICPAAGDIPAAHLLRGVAQAQFDVGKARAGFSKARRGGDPGGMGRQGLPVLDGLGAPRPVDLDRLADTGPAGLALRRGGDPETAAPEGSDGETAEDHRRYGRADAGQDSDEVITRILDNIERPSRKVGALSFHDENMLQNRNGFCYFVVE